MESVFRRQAESGWAQSVFRRVAILLFMLGPGLVLNFALSYGAAKILPAADFASFYVALSLIIVLTAPSTVLAFHLSRQMQGLDLPAKFHATRHFAWLVVRWGGLVALGLTLVLALLGTLVGIQSLFVVVGIVLVTWSTYLVDVGRGFLQSTQQVFRLGLLGLGWMGGRFVLGLALLALTNMAWPGLIGLALSGVLATIWIFIGKEKTGQADIIDIHKLSGLLPFSLCYCLSLSLCFFDLIIGHLSIDRMELGFYAASAVLPKTIVTLTLPVLQVAFPMALEHPDRTAFPMPIVKSLVATAVLSLGAAVVLWLGSDLLCSGGIGIAGCRDSQIAVMGFTTVPLVLVRVLVVMQTARGTVWHSLHLLAPIAAFGAFELLGDLSSSGLALRFAWFGWAVLLYYAGLVALDVGRSRKRLI